MARPNPRYDTESDLSATVTQIISAINENKIVVPSHFRNNIAWVKTGAITHQAFLDAYWYLANQAIIHTAENYDATPSLGGLGAWFFSTPTASGAMISESTPFDLLPQVFAEPEQEIKYPISANVRISFTNSSIGVFSSSIPIADAGQLQALDNASNEWKYTLIGSSTNQPLMTLNGLITKINNQITSVVTPQPEPESKDKPTIEEPQPEPESMETWWVIRPSGVIEQVTVTQKFVDTMTAQGWIFSKDKPTIEEPQNQNISIVFYIGKGGDLKTHFGINSIIVTPDEAKSLAGWLYQNYNTKILFVMNRLTDDIRTHTLQQIKDLIIQKLKDDQPESDDIDDDDIKKPQELGFMGAGIAGVIAGLVLIGFIADHKRGK